MKVWASTPCNNSIVGKFSRICVAKALRQHDGKARKRLTVSVFSGIGSTSQDKTSNRQGNESSFNSILLNTPHENWVARRRTNFCTKGSAKADGSHPMYTKTLL
jgi:hypothetical protein